MICQSKRKKLSRQGRCARKPKRKTNNEQAASFFLCEKMLDLMMEILPSILGNRGRPSKDNRAFLVAVFHVLANGLCWRALPIEHGKWRSVYAKFNRWAKRGVWAELFEQLKQRVKGIDLEYIMVDSTAVRNHKSAMGARGGNQCIGRTAGGPTTKIHMIVDAHGNPLDFTITAGNVHDSKETCNLIQILEEKYLSKDSKYDVEECGQRYFLGDKGYISSIIERILADKGWISLIPSRNNSKKPKIVDKHIYQERRLIENYFERIKGARGISTRYAKTVSMFAAFVTLACSYAWLKLLVD